MRTMLMAGLLLSGMISLSGCGGGDSKHAASGEMVPVAGNITVNDQPAPNSLVTYTPVGGDVKADAGTGMSDSTGRYEITSVRGKKGLVPAKYKVTVSRRLNKDGSPADPNTPPIESQAIETLPPKYTELAQTELSITIASGDKRSFDFSLKTGPAAKTAPKTPPKK
ncbi:hypothetical protein [Zavarzinella formosa]|uniref:hypothetical protein n=1 Tax=Zavarzinella formosa TaxID=360055 RepID=UPI000361DCC6|nr:hypothetical protein [Zavarzinella formosa]